MTTFSQIKIAGEGYYSHPVPTELGQMVLIRDGNHEGTEVYRVAEGFRFVSLDSGTVATSARCALVRLSVSIDDVPAPFGCDLDTPDGLVLVGLDPEEDPSELGDVLWLSDEEVSPTTVDSDELTDSQIRTLRTEAAQAGDLAMVRICTIAVDETASQSERQAARKECARVIAEAGAQVSL